MPEYNNIFIANKKDNFVKVSDGERFIYQTRSAVISKLIEGKQQILEDYVDTRGEQLGKKLVKLYETYSGYLDEEAKNMKEAQDEITCLLLNMKNIVEKNEFDKKNYELLENTIQN